MVKGGGEMRAGRKEGGVEEEVKISKLGKIKCSGSQEAKLDSVMFKFVVWERVSSAYLIASITLSEKGTQFIARRSSN